MSGPPDINTTLNLDATPSDMEYTLAGTLNGIQGTYHRLWAALAMQYTLGDDADTRETISTIRAEFEAKLGRALSDDDMTRLDTHAKHHAHTLAHRK